MVLTKKEILKLINEKGVGFSPVLDQFQLQPHAVDLRLGYNFRLPKSWKLEKEGRKVLTIDPLESPEDNFEEIVLTPGQYFELRPKEFIIAVTMEEIHLNTENLMAVLYPRSSINRRGLSLDLSGIIDVGYKGKLVMPLMNNTNDQIIRIYPGERICQIVFEQLASNINPTEAKLHGVAQAKYHKNDSVASRKDNNEEIEMIKNGKVSELKKLYPVIT